MKALLRIAAVVAALFVATSAEAAPVAYTFTGTGSGTITDDQNVVTPFSGTFTFAFHSDTTLIDFSDPPFFRLFNVGGTFHQGSFSASLTATNVLVASASLELINFFNAAVDNGLGGQHDALLGYDLSTSIGPLTLDPLTPTFGGGCFATTDGGCIAITGNDTLTFTAELRTQAPEPGALALLGLALAGLGFARRKLSA